jgi:hypothetical protein
MRSSFKEQEELTEAPTASLRQSKSLTTTASRVSLSNKPGVEFIKSESQERIKGEEGRRDSHKSKSASRGVSDFFRSISSSGGQTINRSSSSTTAAKVTNKLEDLFETQFTTNLDDLMELAEAPAPSNPKQQNAAFQELKTALHTLVCDIEDLKPKCLAVEERYKEATISASRELQQSMNILFQLQQRTAALEDTSKEVKKLTEDKK